MGCGAGKEAKKEEKGPPLECPISAEELEEKGYHKHTLEAGEGDPVGKGVKAKITFNGYTTVEPYPNFGSGTDKEIDTGKGLVKGMNKGIPEMCFGETAIISCAPSHGYGDQKVPGIPPGSTLLFKVTLNKP
eukprot:TRINITY_DN13625_c0_g1_i1.p1 TRINITY_DN13625_c0_g1~~TRINITY_DN13625_c0_g1_i1.p1  ORF type:complete len:132 (+),score=52.18 TRINITY_DN13625_c0_g1_i1:63-458(+)